jgi:hypothetical protein
MTPLEPREGRGPGIETRILTAVQEQLPPRESTATLTEEVV